MSSVSLHFSPKASISNAKPPAQSPNPDSHRISFPVSSPFQGFKDSLRSSGTKAKAQLSQAVAEKSENSAPVAEKKGESKLPDAVAVSSFMSQVSNLVRMVDSSDITELQLKQLDCEIVIRKKEALQHPPPPPAPLASFPSYPQFAPPPMPLSAATVASPPPPAPAAPAAPPPPTKSSHPPFKCPMPGTFYRASAPGAPPFVKVGDKVQKGQVLCIVEAMKLMNEIESDQAGTITEILVENGSPVSVDTPLFTIEP